MCFILRTYVVSTIAMLICNAVPDGPNWKKVYYGLSLNCPSWAHVFKHLVSVGGTVSGGRGTLKQGLT